MDDRRDDLDRWLQARIDPLPPPPGTFEMIKRRARRRRYRQVAVSAAAAAAVAAAVLVVPHVTSVLRVSPNPTSENAAAGSSSHPANGGRGTVNASGTPAPSTASSTTAPSAPFRPAPVPADFAATSATFVSLKTGWVIGQGGVPGQKCATVYCTSMARTDDAGQSWYGVQAPVTGAPDGASGVSQIRFLDTTNGWAFGPQLWATHDGGQHWTQVPTGGQRVTSLETVGNRAFAIFATCSGTGSAFAAQCTSFTLYSTPASADAWTPVPAVTGLGNSGQAASASLALTATRGYLLAPDGTLYAGPVSGTGSWQQVASGAAGAASCSTGPAQSSGQPSGVLLAAASVSSLALACSAAAAPGGGAQVFTSGDGGATWQASGSVTGVTVTSLAAQPGGGIVLATTDGLDVSANGGASWQLVEAGTTGPAGGFSYVGMTNPHQGIAVPADATEHAIWFTFSAGRAWQRSPIAGS